MSDRVYEILFIADPNLGEPEVDALTALLQGYIEKEGGKVQKVEKWGKKRLAYLIRKHREGSYVLITLGASSTSVKEVERRIRVTDGVIKFMTVRVDEDLRKAERRKGRRVAAEEKKRSRGGSPRPAPTAAPAVEGEGVQQ